MVKTKNVLVRIFNDIRQHGEMNSYDSFSDFAVVSCSVLALECCRDESDSGNIRFDVYYLVVCTVDCFFGSVRVVSCFWIVVGATDVRG